MQGYPFCNGVRIYLRPVFGTMILALSALSFWSPLRAEESARHHPEKTMTAVRINPAPPRIDGLLDDEVWASAPASGDFLQQEPTEHQGEPGTEKTTIQMVYDEEALYVGITCYDSEPKKIAARLTRRDGWVESDWVSLNLDTHHDHQTGNFFFLNAAGVQLDGQMYNDGMEDTTWDGVWEGKAAIHDNGWSAEYKLPYHVLRFSDKAEYIWGMNVIRSISRKKEGDLWVLVRRGESGWVSRFGHIEGIKGIHPPAHLEVLPFIVGRSTFESKKETNPDGRLERSGNP
ncbi:carbohydrate binding family 9 domain-containing protein, partial [Candidatus Poribacteria bacterium]|nr:carbohydrate binding family 9 domain-containing protein [Candidatus Poribacteria bacterium]